MQSLLVIFGLQLVVIYGVKNPWQMIVVAGYLSRQPIVFVRRNFRQCTSFRYSLAQSGLENRTIGVGKGVL